MRLALAIVILLTATAHADTGVYVSESIGGSWYTGPLSAYGTEAPRLQIGVGVRRGVWTVEGLVAATIPGMFYIDCYGAECEDDGKTGSWVTVGFDIRRAWPILATRFKRAEARVFVDVGPRVVVGDEALTGYSGPGVHGSVGIEGDFFVIGYFVAVGVDAMWLHMPADDVAGISPHIMFGGRMGWL